MKTVMFGFFILLVFSCQTVSSQDLENERREILRLEYLQREYHFTKNARDFVDLFSEDFISINRGSIDTPSREKSFEMFDAYFNRVEFIAWDDVVESVVRFSKDASVAYVAVDKLVVVKRPREDGVMHTDSTKFAWLTVYKKENKKWKIDCVTSTNK